jgi:hypothetical protein
MAMTDKKNTLEQPKTNVFDNFVEQLRQSEFMFPDDIEISVLIKILTNIIDGINEFKNNTSTPNEFIDISQLEKLIIKTKKKSSSLIVEQFQAELLNLNEDWMIVKKKQEFSDKGIILRKYMRYKRTVMTLAGELSVNRMALKATTSEGAKTIKTTTGKRFVFPLDEALGLNRLPYKLTVGAMLEVAYWVQLTHSYSAALKAIERNTRIVVNDETIRQVANTVGRIVFDNDVDDAKKTFEKYVACEIIFPPKKIPHTLYLEADGAMLHTREKNEDGNPWKENKLGVAFSSDNIHWYTNKKGEREHNVLKREYRSFLGNSDEFNKHMFALALRNGYGRYEHTVLISDGASWIKTLKETYFPDAQHILDFYHLCENISNFAKTVFETDSLEFKAWTKKVFEMFKASQTDDGIEEITKLKVKKKDENEKGGILGYIERHKNNIDYASYKRNGWFIGSGAIESGNKSVLQQRLKQQGMRWTIQNGQYILTLMSKSKSFIWEQDVVRPVLSHYGFN